MIKTTATSAGAGSPRRFSRWMAAAVVGLLGVSALVVDRASADGFSGSAAGVPLTSGSMYNVVDQVGARSLWAKGFTGRGVNVAVIDTGVADVPALSGPDKVVAMVDLSLEAGVPEARYIDTFGHGTHVSGIIAGRDPGADPALAVSHPEWFLGVAPDAGIVSVKVGDNSGAVDVTQVIAGVDWVIEHAVELNIRVINLSYGSGSTLGYRDDPLSFAVERAWKAGIVVVVAVGNDGKTDKNVDMPAANPYVIAVAGAEGSGTGFRIPTWSSWGKGRLPDIAAPGASIVSLRAPGSRIAIEHPEGYVNEYLFKGSGSSQAAAVVSGLAALLVDARPSLTPDQVKAVLKSSADAQAINPRAARYSGDGLVRIDRAVARAASTATQTWPASIGAGSLDAARGGVYITVNGKVLQGEVTVLGAPWNGVHWAGVHWAGGSWNGVHWAGASWLGVHWATGAWTGVHWAGSAWNGVHWAGVHWAGTAWSASSWSGTGWDGVHWADLSTVAVTWDGVHWASAGGGFSGVHWAVAGWV